ncbi:MAG: hypothetical protein GYB68_03305 [Chloroflexi bacterium]|nr:hypothetical protein [Chloroflexota bacterium]
MSSQATDDPFLIGALGPTDVIVDVMDGFRAHMEERGLVEGEHVNYIVFEAEAIDQLSFEEPINDMLNQGVDLLVTVDVFATRAAQEFTLDSGVPVLFTAADPLNMGIVSDLTQPGGFATGIATRDPHNRRLELFNQLVPEAETVNVIFLTGLFSTQEILPLRSTAEGLGIALLERPITNPNAATERLLEQIPPEADAIFLVPNMHRNWSGNLAEAAQQAGIPLIVNNASLASEDAFMSYAISFPALGRQLGRMAEQVLVNGVDPGSLPDETAEYFLVVNVAIGDELGLELSPRVLRQADILIYPDEVITQ